MVYANLSVFFYNFFEFLGLIYTSRDKGMLNFQLGGDRPQYLASSPLSPYVEQMEPLR